MKNSLNPRFNEADWDRIRRDWTAWWHQETDRAMVVFDLSEEQRINFIPQFPGWEESSGEFPVKAVLDHYQHWFIQENYYGDSFPRWWINFGAGVIAAYLGAGVKADKNTVWFHPPEKMDWSLLTRPQDPNNFWWRWVRELTGAAVERWGSEVSISMTDLGGNLDILASLRGTQEFLLDLAVSPREVLIKVRQLTEKWWWYFQQLEEITTRGGPGFTCWAPMWCPGSYYMLQSDLSYMISPRMFEQYVLPDLQALCQRLEYSFYHLDGKGQLNHLEMLLSLEDLDGVQWIPGAGAPSAEDWPEVLQRIRDAGKLCQVYVDPPGALKIVQELGPNGLTIMVSPPPPEAEIPDFLNLFHSYH
jgi:5-methyltetrahydrofolate--homocysteine methyltransferase